MRKLFKVIFEDEWDDRENIFILANGFDDAAEKSLMIKESKRTEIGVLDEDGDLTINQPEYKVRKVELITENLYGIRDKT